MTDTLPLGSIAKARKIARKARPAWYNPPRPELASPEQQDANRLASTYQCPHGVAPKFRHLILIGTGEGCAHCGLDSITIIDQHNQQETP